jgi:hypothetical protein
MPFGRLRQVQCHPTLQMGTLRLWGFQCSGAAVRVPRPHLLMPTHLYSACTADVGLLVGVEVGVKGTQGLNHGRRVAGAGMGLPFLGS